jgi:hypothetical protein
MISVCSTTYRVGIVMYVLTVHFDGTVSAVEFGLVFPSAVKTEPMDAEARVMLVWLKKDKYWVSLGGKG